MSPPADSVEHVLPTTPSAPDPPTPVITVLSATASLQVKLAGLPNVYLPHHAHWGNCALKAVSIEEAQCRVCRSTIKGGGASRGNLLARALHHCEKTGHKTAMAPVLASSTLSFASAPATDGERLAQLQLQHGRALESATVRCTGYFSLQHDYGEFVGNPPCLLHERLGENSQPYRDDCWLAYPQDDNFDSPPCFHSVACVNASFYHKPTPALAVRLQV